MYTDTQENLHRERKCSRFQQLLHKILTMSYFNGNDRFLNSFKIPLKAKAYDIKN